MKYAVGFFIGLAFSYYALSQKSTTLYGGAFTTSEVANIYGYADDYAGCSQISACLNYAQNNQMLTGAFSEKWANTGNHYCR